MSPGGGSSKKRKAVSSAAAVTAAAVVKKTAKTTAAAATNFSKTTTAPATTTTKTATATTTKTTATIDRTALHAEIGYEPLSLQDIHDRIVALCRRIPRIPDSGFALPVVETETITIDDSSINKKPSTSATKKQEALVVEAVSATASTTSTIPVETSPCPYDKVALKSWATGLQTVLEEFHLLLALVSAATYRWGTDRSGAADQNLSLLSNELVRSQEQILGRVTPRLNDVLAPVVSLLTDKTVTTKDSTSGTEVKQNYFITTPEDPDYVNLCYTILARNAASMRHVVLANFDKLLQAVNDYLDATVKDSQHDSRGYAY